MPNCGASSPENENQLPKEIPKIGDAGNGIQRLLAGGLLFSQQSNFRSDLALVRRAVREGWPMKPEDYVRLWARVTEIRAHHVGRIAKAADATLEEFRKSDSGHHTR
jgi:hypothetical protein